MEILFIYESRENSRFHGHFRDFNSDDLGYDFCSLADMSVELLFGATDAHRPSARDQTDKPHHGTFVATMGGSSSRLRKNTHFRVVCDDRTGALGDF